jgi:hypothetical protein
MTLYFLGIPCVCFITGYFLLKKNNNEISHLVAVFAAISLILGLMLAPWQILLLLQYPQQPVPKSEPDHNLTYRGAFYRTDLNGGKSDGLTIPPVTHKLSFRGCTYFVCVDPNQSSGVTTPPVTYKLSFRGSTYSVNKTAYREIKEQGS